jgi:hypothetical protein
MMTIVPTIPYPNIINLRHNHQHSNSQHAKKKGGLPPSRDANASLEPVLREVIAGLDASQPDRLWRQ